MRERAIDTYGTFEAACKAVDRLELSLAEMIARAELAEKQAQVWAEFAGTKAGERDAFEILCQKQIERAELAEYECTTIKQQVATLGKVIDDILSSICMEPNGYMLYTDKFHDATEAARKILKEQP